MEKFIQTTLIALLISSAVLAQTKNEPVKNPAAGTVVNQASNSSLLLLSPADGQSFNGSENSKPVLFRWIAISPKPKEAVTYRLRVWQLMQGQNRMEAMRNNQPIITKDVVNITQAAISNVYTGPCRPPYLCDFVWAVEVFNADEINTGEAYVASEHYSFKFNTAAEVSAGLATADNKGNAGNTGMSGGKSLNAQGDPVHGVDIKLGTKPLKDQQNTYALYLPIEKIIFDTDGNVTGVMIKTDRGESGFVKVLVAGSKSISGGYMMLKTEEGEPLTAKVVVAGSNSISGGVK